MNIHLGVDDAEMPNWLIFCKDRRLPPLNTESKCLSWRSIAM
jgi:hypothetical protein